MKPISEWGAVWQFNTMEKGTSTYFYNTRTHTCKQMAYYYIGFFS